jgi:hypothetical protein
MSHLNDLPAPFPLEILKRLPDLKSLDASRRSSQLFAILFANHAAEILESIMQASLSDDVATKVRLYILALIWRKEGYSRNTTVPRLEIQAMNPLPRRTSAIAISYVVRKLCFLASAGELILEEKLSHLQTLSHEHLGDASYNYTSGRAAPTSGIRYTVQNLSPPIWSEQQRMLRAMVISRILHIWPRHLSSRQWLEDDVLEMDTSFEQLQFNGTIQTDESSPMSWQPLADPPPRTKQVRRCETFESSNEGVNYSSHGYVWFHSICHRWYSPFQDRDWDVFRRLGFGFWSHKRLAVELEMSNHSGLTKRHTYRTGIDGHMNRSKLIYTWWRLYFAEESASRM